MGISSLFHMSNGLGSQSVEWINILASSSSDAILQTTTVTQNLSTTQSVPIKEQLICQLFLVKRVGTSLVKVWDLAMLIPNLLFFVFLLMIFRQAVTQLRRTNSPIFTAFFVLVVLADVISILRCVTSMILNANMKDVSTEDRIMWLVLRFFLLATELSVVVFGLLFGHLDSRTSIQRVLIFTFLISFIYSVTQGTLEFFYENQPFHNVTYENDSYTLFGHGGMIFWFVSSVCLFLVYGVIFILPFTRIQQRFTLPTKKSFFWYCFLLACLNIVQAIGSALLYFSIQPGMCVVNMMAYLYFTGFAPLVYATFLHQFFTANPATSIRFSYKLQVDDDDDVNLPHQASNYESEESATGPEVAVGSIDSTHFNNSSPLYADLGNRPELSFNRDHFAYSPANIRKQKSNELQHLSA